MAALEAAVREIEQDGLVWGASKLVPIGYGIRKMQITVVIEDEKVSLDELQDKIAEVRGSCSQLNDPLIQAQFEDYVQSSDVCVNPPIPTPLRCSPRAQPGHAEAVRRDSWLDFSQSQAVAAERYLSVIVLAHCHLVLEHHEKFPTRQSSQR